MFSIAQPNSADRFIGRLREIEKIAIRMASNPDALEYLRTRNFAYDMLTPAVMAEAKQKIDAIGVVMPPPNTQTWAI